MSITNWGVQLCVLLRRSRSCYSTEVVRSVCIVQLLAGSLVLGALSCSGNDIGQPCPDVLGTTAPAGGGGGRAETQEVVEQNLNFPCDELICVATGGRPGYCSKKCLTDDACPTGFECRVIQARGQFAGQGFCAWQGCDSDAACGGGKCCRVVDGTDPVEEQRLCDFKEGDEC